jgi:GH15 family glucan-1,4-alpha-glucosidase
MDGAPPVGYAPIRDYALIGCTRSAALVSKSGSIDWLCWPRFDSPSVFARILDSERGGHFSIRPTVPFKATRRYVDGSNVLETTFITEGGSARLTDFMPVMTEEQKTRRLTAFRQLMRQVETIEGEVPFEVEYAPRPEYGKTVPRLEVRRGALACVWSAYIMYLRSDGPVPSARFEFTLRQGERRTFALSFDDHTPAVLPQIEPDIRDESIAFWREWSSQLTYSGPYREYVMRSVLLLKLLAYAPSGGIVAAPTTSLPEQIGGVRNWDYRYCWLRDASFTVSALYDCGFETEGAAFLNWLVYATRLTHPRLHILYDVFGESKVPERNLDHLDGYRGSRPVRAGNNAYDQFQLDVYGEVLGAIDEAAQRGEPLSRDMKRLMHRLADQVEKRWREPDMGIWEKRSGRQQHIHAKVMAWSALDCAERILGDTRWAGTKDEIHDYVLTEGFNRELNSFTSIAGEPEVDAALLYIARVGLLEADDPRMAGTIDAIRKRLARGELIYRYDTRSTDDGLPTGEGAFLACSFWLVEALALGGRDAEAREVFERLIARANDVGLFSEEIDPESGEMTGNFPQALTHIALINAALCLEKAAPRVSAGSKTRQA